MEHVLAIKVYDVLHRHWHLMEFSSLRDAIPTSNHHLPQFIYIPDRGVKKARLNVICLGDKYNG